MISACCVFCLRSWFCVGFVRVGSGSGVKWSGVEWSDARHSHHRYHQSDRQREDSLHNTYHLSPFSSHTPIALMSVSGPMSKRLLQRAIQHRLAHSEQQQFDKNHTKPTTAWVRRSGKTTTIKNASATVRSTVVGVVSKLVGSRSFTTTTVNNDWMKNLLQSKPSLTKSNTPQTIDPTAWSSELGLFGCPLRQPSDFEILADEAHMR